MSTDTKNYLIQTGTDMIYFEYNITTLNKDLQMKPLKINMSLSTTKGIILYCLDKNKNQFILSVDEYYVPLVNIEFNGYKLTKSLSELCNCKKCTNEPLLFNIWINGECIVKCNGIKVNIANKKSLNEAYPLFKIDSPHEARIWLVNTPQYDRWYPSNNQPSGCIYDILYGEEPIKLKRYGKFPEESCVSRCDATLCNGGTCIENYGIHPLCNCSNTFEKGKYCNESINLDKETKRIIHNANFMFKRTKISWNGNSSKIFSARNNNFSMKIYSYQSFLKLEFEDRTKKLLKVAATLMKDYTNNKPNSLIIWFEDQMIKVNLSKKLTIFSIPINHKLANEMFHTIELQGPSAYVILFTYSNGDEWNYFNSLQYTDEQIVKSTPISSYQNTSKVLKRSMNSGVWQYSLLGILILISVINSIVLIVIRIRLCELHYVYENPPVEEWDRCDVSL